MNSRFLVSERVIITVIFYDYCGLLVRSFHHCGNGPLREEGIRRNELRKSIANPSLWTAREAEAELGRLPPLALYGLGARLGVGRGRGVPNGGLCSSQLVLLAVGGGACKEDGEKGSSSGGFVGASSLGLYL